MVSLDANYSTRDTCSAIPNCNPSQTPSFAHTCRKFPSSDLFRLQKEFQGVLENLLELTHPISTSGTVNDLVVEAASNGNLVIPLNNGLTILVLGGHGDLSGGANSQDSGLGRVDDGSEVLDSIVHAHVGDGDGAALVLLGLELTIARLLGELLDLGGDGLEATSLDTGNNGGDEASGGGDGDRDVDSGELTDNITAPAGIGGGDLLGSDTNGLDEEVVDGQLVLALAGGVQGLSQLQQLGHGDGAADVEVRVGLGGLQQSVGNGLSHSADGSVLKGGAGSGNGGAGDQLLDVLLGDLASLARALDALQADTRSTGKSDGSGDSIGFTVESGLESALGSVLLRSRGGLRGRGGG